MAKKRRTHCQEKGRNCVAALSCSRRLPSFNSFYPSFYLLPPLRSPSLSPSVCSRLSSNPIRQRHRTQISLLAVEEQHVSTERVREREGARENGKERMGERETEIDC